MRFPVTHGLFLTLALLAGPSPSRADDKPASSERGEKTGGPRLSGRIFSDVYIPARDTDTSPYRFAGTTAWLQADMQLGETTSGRLLLEGDAWDTTLDRGTSGATGSELRTIIREGYLDYSRAGLQFRAGRQIIPWGKADVVNPTDLLSAKDYRILNPEEEIRRIGATSILAAYTPAAGASPLTLQIIVTPIFPQSRLLIPARAIPTGLTLLPDPVASPATVGNSETGIKAAWTGSGWDASALFFRGFNHVAEYTRVSATTIAPVSHHVHATGGDFSFTTGSWIVRGEGAYVWTQNDDGTNPVIQPTHLDTVVGVERPLGTDFRAQAQVIWRYIPNFTDPNQTTGPDPVSAAINLGLARANALLMNYQDQSRPGATLRLSYIPDGGSWDSEVFVLGNFAGGDYLVRPKASYAWTDAFRTTLGLDWYGGPDDRTLGALKDFNSIFVEAKIAF